MTISRFFFLVCLVFSFVLPISASNTPAANSEKPENIPIIKMPCYIGCDYNFQYCYNYNIFNLSDAIEVTEWKNENGWIEGHALVNANANLLVKLCYQLSLTSAYAVIDKQLNLKAEFDLSLRKIDKFHFLTTIRFVQPLLNFGMPHILKLDTRAHCP